MVSIICCWANFISIKQVYRSFIVLHDNNACQIETGSVYFVISKPTGAQVHSKGSCRLSLPEPTMIYSRKAGFFRFEFTLICHLGN